MQGINNIIGQASTIAKRSGNNLGMLFKKLTCSAESESLMTFHLKATFHSKVIPKTAHLCIQCTVNTVRKIPKSQIFLGQKEEGFPDNLDYVHKNHCD